MQYISTTGHRGWLVTSKVLCPVAVHLYNWSQGLVVKKTVTNEAWSWCVLLLYIYNWQQELVVETAVMSEVCCVVAVHLQLPAGVVCLKEQ